MKIYDYIIIGAGPSGLYTAKRLEEKYSDKSISILILEKSRKVGGRTHQARFHSRLVTTGAGVGRYPKDRLLMKSLLQVMPMFSIKPVHTRICYQMSQPVDTLWYIQQLKEKKEWIQRHRSTFNFKQCFLHFFSASQYQRFCQSNGFTDFERADIIDTLYDYGFEDNQNGRRFFYMPWNQWTSHLRTSLQKSKLLFHQTVVSVQRWDNDFFSIHTLQGYSYQTINVIYAGSLDVYPYLSIRKGIGYQPFLRLYSYSKTPRYSTGTVYLDNRLQKTISLTKHIDLVSYSDNQNAQKTVHSTKTEIEKLCGHPIDDWQAFYWEKGTHFYYPLDTSQFANRKEFIRLAQHPEPHVFLVGEVISKNQGWTEGALESVEAILPEL